MEVNITNIMMAAVWNSHWQFCVSLTQRLSYPQTHSYAHTYLNIKPDVLFWARWLVQTFINIIYECPARFFLVGFEITYLKGQFKKNKIILELFNVEVKWRLTVSTSRFDYMFAEWCLEVYFVIFLLFIYSLIYVLFNIVQFWP